MGEPPRILRIDEIEPLPGPGTLQWLPIRWLLDLHGFGTNAYVAQHAGDDVVEPHTEAPTFDHQELYFVARGHATFTIDGDEHDAPAGTYVFIPDPSSHRHAIAREPGTTVLSFGGPPTFTPSAWEWRFRASAARRTDPAQARAILEDGLRTLPEDGSLFYDLACLEAVERRHEEALEHLRTAIGVATRFRSAARADPDFESLSGDAAFQALTAEQPLDPR